MAKKMIVLIGPIAPFRGGIAQYNTQLHKALKKKVELKTYSFKRLYPKILYPGKSDKEPDVKSIPCVEYTLDFFSPLSVSRSIKIISKSEPDLVLITWWTLIWQPAMAYFAWRLKSKGIKTTYICHNLVDHDSNWATKQVARLLLRQAEYYVLHATDEEKALKKIKPSAKTINTKSLPIYNTYPVAQNKLKKRGRLELLFFGFIRPYKGLDILLKALGNLEDKQVYLTVIGEPWNNKEDIISMVKNNKLEDRTDLLLEYVDDQKAASYFERADVVVLPYKNATGSAVASLAFHYKKPVIASRVGGLKDVVKKGKTGWLVSPGSVQDLANTIKTVTRKDAHNTKQPISIFCEQHSWEALAEKIVSI